MDVSQLPLPYGWVKQYDPNSSHDFYVDTKADPPRAIWTHPYEDEEYLSQHEDLRRKITEGGMKPPVPDRSTRPPSYSQTVGGKSSSSGAGTSSKDKSKSSEEKGKRPGLLSKLKDKTIGTKEEREQRAIEQERKREQRMAQQAAYEQMLAEEARERREQQMAYEQARGYGGPPGAGYPGAGYPGEGYAYPQQGPAGYGAYGPPPGDPYYNGRRRGRGGMGGGMALPLLGGLAGGLLLGDILDGGFGGGGFDGGFGGGLF